MQWNGFQELNFLGTSWICPLPIIHHDAFGAASYFRTVSPGLMYFKFLHQRVMFQSLSEVQSWGLSMAQ